MVDDLTDLPSGVELRPVNANDRDLLLSVYASTRAEQLGLLLWSEDEKAAFVAMQFDAQATWYLQTYPGGEFLVIVRDGESIGRLYLARLDDEIRIVDISLLPAARGAGIGSRLIASVLSRADRLGLRVTLHVEPWNRAKRLYQRYGFETIEQRGVYEFMARPARRQLKTAS